MVRDELKVFGAVLFLLALVMPAAAQAQRIRGEISKVDGAVLTIKTRGGTQETVRLAAGANVAAVEKASLADIKPDSYVGCAALPEADGTLKALEVHIFPPTMRGVGEGSRPFDLEPGSSMTNGAISGSATAASGSTFQISYAGGVKTVVVTPSTPIVTMTGGSLADVKPGVGIVVFGSMPAADGVRETKAVVVGRNGTNPPM
jgi:hypothetical protein